MSYHHSEVQDKLPGLQTSQDTRRQSLERTVALFLDRITLLEEENARFADMLKERGVDARPSSKIALELPPVIREPLDQNSETRALMTSLELKLLEDVCGNETVLVLFKSDSLVDTGGWFRRSRVWVGATAEELVLLAFGRNPFFQKTPFQVMRESLYNHVTGELVLAPVRQLTLNSVKVPPLDGYQLLAQIYGNGQRTMEKGEDHD